MKFSFRRDLMTPVEFVEATKYLFKLCAVKYPLSSRVLPIVIFTGLGVACMEFSNPSTNNSTSFISIKKKKNVDRIVTDDKFMSDNDKKTVNDTRIDPYDKELMKKLEEEKRMNMKPETRRVYDMLNGLKYKTREQKLQDAFDAYDNFMMPQNEQQPIMKERIKKI
eukprot:g1155.t1